MVLAVSTLCADPPRKMDLRRYRTHRQRINLRIWKAFGFTERMITLGPQEIQVFDATTNPEKAHNAIVGVILLNLSVNILLLADVVWNPFFYITFIGFLIVGVVSVKYLATGYFVDYEKKATRRQRYLTAKFFCSSCQITYDRESGGSKFLRSGQIYYFCPSCKRALDSEKGK